MAMKLDSVDGAEDAAKYVTGTDENNNEECLLVGIMVDEKSQGEVGEETVAPGRLDE